MCLFLDVDYYAEAWWDWPASPEGGGGIVVSCSGARNHQLPVDTRDIRAHLANSSQFLTNVLIVERT